MEIYVSTISSAKRDYPSSQYEAHLYYTRAAHKGGGSEAGSRDSERRRSAARRQGTPRHRSAGGLLK